MYIIWLFSNFRCWSTRPIFHSWIFRGGWAFFRLCGFRKSVGGQLGAHEKSRLWNNEVVQPHNRGQGSRLEGTIEEVWLFNATFVFMALWLWSFKFGDTKRTDLKITFSRPSQQTLGLFSIEKLFHRVLSVCLIKICSKHST